MKSLRASHAAGFNKLSILGAVLVGIGGCTSSHSTNVSELHAGSAAELYAQGREAYQQGRLDDAQKQLAAAIAADPKAPRPHELLGDLYKDRGQYSQAGEQYEAVIRLNPQSAEGYGKLGLVQQLTSHPQQAATNYQRALDLNPDDWQSSMNLGLARFAAGDIDEAVAYTRRATEIAPREPVAWANLAVMLDSENHFADAEAAYRQSLRLKGDQPVTRLNLASNLIAQKKGSDAIKLLESLVHEQNTAQVHTLHGGALKLLESLDHEQNTAQVHTLHGDVLLLDNRPADAQVQYHEALKLDARSFAALNGLGQAQIAQYQSGGQTNEHLRQSAVEAWMKSLAIAPQQPQVQQWVRTYGQKK